MAGSLVLTSLGGLLPIAAEYARRERMHGRKWAAWLAIPLALAFVFTVSVQRTGSASDLDEAGRQQIAAAIAIAKKEQAEAEKQLVIDQQMVASNCDVIGPKSKAAMDAKAATEAKVARARAVLKRQGVVVDDSMANRLTAWFPFLKLYQRDAAAQRPCAHRLAGSSRSARAAARSSHRSRASRRTMARHLLAPDPEPVKREKPPAPSRPHLGVVNPKRPIGGAVPGS